MAKPQENWDALLEGVASKILDQVGAESLAGLIDIDYTVLSEEIDYESLADRVEDDGGIIESLADRIDYKSLHRELDYTVLADEVHKMQTYERIMEMVDDPEVRYLFTQALLQTDLLKRAIEDVVRDTWYRRVWRAIRRWCHV